MTQVEPKAEPRPTIKTISAVLNVKEADMA